MGGRAALEAEASLSLAAAPLPKGLRKTETALETAKLQKTSEIARRDSNALTRWFSTRIDVEVCRKRVTETLFLNLDFSVLENVDLKKV